VASAGATPFPRTPSTNSYPALFRQHPNRGQAPRVRGRKAGGRSCGRGVCRSRCGRAPPRRRPWRGSTKGSVGALTLEPAAWACSAAGGRGVTSDPGPKFARPRAGLSRGHARAGSRGSIQSRQRDFPKHPWRVFPGRCFRHFWAKGDEPLAIPLHDGGIAVSHAHKLSAEGGARNLKNRPSLSQWVCGPWTVVLALSR